MRSYLAKILENSRNDKRKQKLKNQNFTILASECAGGVIYHKLGLKFLSPTINLWFKPSDFLKFLNNLEYYLNSAPLIEEKNSKLDYPVGILGDKKMKIKLYFLHYTSFQDAMIKWNKRKKRVNLSNLFVIMTDRDGADIEMLKKFDRLPFENKVILTGKAYPEIKSALLLDNCVEDGHLGDLFKTNFFTGKSKLDDFDFVEFLNGNGNKLSD
ncbi:hypothetical protein N134_05800 [Limosilactobacillus reuteri TD1]|uniref:Exopolysaccharide biosynthesis protein n=1 Tax=Limosilactobacillus reuteri TD1 TaxID=1358027 RepID=S5N7R4_LIMRT|nr:DUF1919 domain-containing protein [Limosilactobacillus reuteri]AGR65201.1 hypothetical protein N134_05800 [Limosilactobacillus reuteri TD1]